MSSTETLKYLLQINNGFLKTSDAVSAGVSSYPEAVFSHETALYLLNLANRETSPFSVTLRTGANSARLAKEGIKVHKVKESLFNLGMIETMSPSEHTLRSYNAERTICDLFRSRRNIEIQTLQDAVKTYVQRKKKHSAVNALC